MAGLCPGRSFSSCAVPLLLNIASQLSPVKAACCVFHLPKACPALPLIPNWPQIGDPAAQPRCPPLSLSRCWGVCGFARRGKTFCGLLPAINTAALPHGGCTFGWEPCLAAQEGKGGCCEHPNQGWGLEESQARKGELRRSNHMGLCLLKNYSLATEPLLQPLSLQLYLPHL